METWFQIVGQNTSGMMEQKQKSETTTMREIRYGEQLASLTSYYNRSLPRSRSSLSRLVIMIQAETVLRRKLVVIYRVVWFREKVSSVT